MSACKGSVFCVETVLGLTHGFAPTGARIVGYKWKCLLCADLLRIKNFALLFQTQNHNFMSRSPLQSTFDVRTRHYKFGAKRPFIPNSKFQIQKKKAPLHREASYKKRLHFRRSKLDLFRDVCVELVDPDALLLHGVAVADGHAAVVCGIKVVGDAERRADLVLTAVALADGAGLVKVGHKVLAQHVGDLACLCAQLFAQRQHRSLERRQRRMQVHDHTGVLFVELFFVVCLDDDRQEQTLHAQRRLDNIGHIALAGRLVKVVERLAAGVDVLGQVVVGAVGDAPQLAPAEGEEVFKVGGRLGIEAQLLLLVVAQTEVFGLDMERIEEVAAEAAPVVEPFKVGAGLAEELKLHLLKLAHAENEVAGRDLVAEGFADLRHAERDLFARGALDVRKVHKDALRGLGTQIELVFGALGDALEGLEHQVELTNIGEVVLAAVGTGNLLFFDVYFTSN